MERIKNLDRYQKGILLLLITMTVVFCVVYAVVTSRVGFLYKDVILEPTTDNGTVSYTGTIEDQECRFTVTDDKTVTFYWGETVYGPYTVKDDPSAIPEDDVLRDVMKGVEIKNGETVIFRGGVYQVDDFWTIVSQDGNDAGFSFTMEYSDGTVLDWNGNVVDPMEPSLSDILSLVEGPELTRKGSWLIWVMGVILSSITAVSILFADELFRLRLAFRIQNAEDAEPSDWEISTRYISWTLLTIMVLVAYILGLRV